MASRLAFLCASRRSIGDISTVRAFRCNLEDAPKVSSASVVNVELNRVAQRHSRLHLFELHFYGCGPAVKA
jgi:hypothetical protein